MCKISYRRHRFPPVIIQHAVWLYCRFTLSYRERSRHAVCYCFTLRSGVRSAERGLDLSYETVRRWVLKFGRAYARRIQRRRPRPTERWHLDEMVVVIRGRQFYLWRAVDSEGEVLDFLVQSRRNARAAIRLMRKLLKKQGFAPATIVTDKLRSFRLPSRLSMSKACERTIGQKIHISRCDDESERCSGSNRPRPRSGSSPSMRPSTTSSTSNAIWSPAEHSANSAATR